MNFSKRKMLDSYPKQPNYIPIGDTRVGRRNSSANFYNSPFGSSPPKHMPDVVTAVMAVEKVALTAKKFSSPIPQSKRMSLATMNGIGRCYSSRKRSSVADAKPLKNSLTPTLARRNTPPQESLPLKKMGEEQRQRKRAMSRPCVERSQSQFCRTGALFRDRSQRHSRRSYDVTALAMRRPISIVTGPASEQSQPNDDKLQQAQLTLVLMGAPKVGKSALVNQFLWEGFLQDYRPTVEEFNWVEYGSAEEPDTQLLLQIIDSSGSRDFLAMRHLYYRIGDAFMVVYAENDAQSYSEALQMLCEIDQFNTRNAPILLIANKTDVLSDSMSKEGTSSSLGSTNGGELPEALDEREQQLLQSVRRMRISARNLDQVKGAFCWLIEELVRRAQLTALPLREGRPLAESEGRAATAKKSLTRRRQSLPSRRTASELGIDQEQLRRLAHKHDLHNRHACCIQ